MGLDVWLSSSEDRLTLNVKCLESPKLKFNATFLNNTFYGVNRMAIKAGNKVQLSIAPVDQFGNAAKLDGIAVWGTSDVDLGTLETTEDGISSIFTSTGKMGQVTVTVTADADLTGEIRALTGSVVVDIEAGEAVDLGVHADPIVVQMAPAADAPVDQVV